ncbi:MAG: right-handed parallel beta-helix repeat-containing protein [Planctomycetes bacterium]|nr:right-handed parallel beta-helix repeat-containing protein [Planctomycetota bacterium]
MCFKSSFTIPALVAITFCLIGETTPVLADIINVPGDQPTIQAGIDAAMDGDEVVVADGTYIGAGNKNLAFNDASLTLRSANGPANCVIDCEDDGRGFFLVNETGTIIIEGFTVMRGYVGIASPGSRRGGAVYCVGSFATFANCIFYDNHAHAGGGAFVAGPDTGAVFINCLITNHVFDGDGSNEDIHTGGGAFVRSGANVEFINCTIADNAVLPGGDHVGGGIHVRDDSSVLLTNCVLWGNSAEFGDQIGVTVGGIVTVHNSDVQGGEAEVVVIDDDGTVNWGAGNIDLDPRFVDPENGDYHLSPGSPSIDAGNNWRVSIDENDYDEDGVLCELFPVDLDGNPRFNADEADFDPGCGVPVVVDMGAYEYQFDPADQVTFADLTADAAVNTLDLLSLFAKWGPCTKGCCLADLDLDGNVNTADLLILFANWGPCP